MSKHRHPGIILKEKLESSGWTHDELAAITGKSRASISKILAGSVGISPEMAKIFSAAFGDSAEDWLKWGGQYELSLVDAPIEEISKRAKLYAELPIRDMQKRGWITASADSAILQIDLERLVGPQNDETLSFHLAARKSDPLAELSPKEKAWALRARQLASALPVSEYNPQRMSELIRKLRVIAAYPEESKKLSLLLADYGIKFLIVEPLAGSRIDGAVFWIGKSPAIAMSIRFDRNDNFWFTFFHELGHVLAQDAYSFDNLGGPEDEGFRVGDLAAEEAADHFAANTLIPAHELNSFIGRVAPLYQETRIIQFSNRVKMHPGIVLGQLHKRGEITYGAHRKLIAKIRDLATRTALTDGWGHSISPRLFNLCEATR